MRYPGFGDGVDFRKDIRKLHPGTAQLHSKTIGRTSLGQKYDPLSKGKEPEDPPPPPPRIQRTPDTSEAARLRRLAEPNRRGRRLPLIGGVSSPTDTARLGE